jgi:hypothetical protein
MSTDVRYIQMRGIKAAFCVDIEAESPPGRIRAPCTICPRGQYSEQKAKTGRRSLRELSCASAQSIISIYLSVSTG